MKRLRCAKFQRSFQDPHLAGLQEVEIFGVLGIRFVSHLSAAEFCEIMDPRELEERRNHKHVAHHDEPIQRSCVGDAGKVGPTVHRQRRQSQHCGHSYGDKNWSDFFDYLANYSFNTYCYT